MFFLIRHINQLLSSASTTSVDHLESELAEIIPRVAVNRRDHHHFGPFWWWVKSVASTMPGSRRSWIRGSYRDHRAIDTWSNAIDGLTPPGRNPENDRRIAAIGLTYFRHELLDDEPAGFHVVDVSTESAAEVYHLFDGDASEQIDLFSDASDESRKIESSAVFRDPTVFSASAWLRRAEQEIERNNVLGASAALRRAIARAIDQNDRSRAWLRLGQVLQEAGALHPAILCYRNAFERDQEAWLHGLMGSAWMDAGDAGEAARCYRKALAAMPDNPEYQAGLAEAERLCSAGFSAGKPYALASERLAR